MVPIAVALEGARQHYPDAFVGLAEDTIDVNPDVAPFLLAPAPLDALVTYLHEQSTAVLGELLQVQKPDPETHTNAGIVAIVFAEEADPALRSYVTETWDRFRQTRGNL